MNWKIYYNADTEYYAIQREDAQEYEFVCSCISNKAHAGLIVRAPKMREILQDIVNAHARTETCNMPDWLENAEQILGEI